MRILLSFVFCGLVASNGNAYAPDPLSPVGERYAHLVLALGQHDPDYVDAFYGPAEWKTHDAISAERPLVPSYHLGAQSAHDHPFVSALLEEIHKNKLTANVFSIVKPFFGDACLDYGHIAEHLHIHRSNFKRQEFVLAGFKIAYKALLSENFARGIDGCPIVGIDLVELVDIAGHHCISCILCELLHSLNNGRIL